MGVAEAVVEAEEHRLRVHNEPCALPSRVRAGVIGFVCGALSGLKHLRIVSACSV
jgi:hypothetical protein